MNRINLSSLYRDLQGSIASLDRDKSRVASSREIVEAALLDGKPYYGINTGFGGLSEKRIDPEQITQLQRNLILSHAVGVGDLVPKPISRLILGFKIHALGLGYSGISLETFDRLVLYWKRGLIPAIPSRGSVGASGDLAPLAHLAVTLLGHGYFWNTEGTSTVAAEGVLAAEGIEPLELQAKDGLSLINGTQFMTAYGAWVLELSMRLAKGADVVAAMSLEALQGSVKPFDRRMQEVRPHAGQSAVAANVRALLAGSEIMESHRDCGKIQDPYCLRCVPQVHGASRDGLAYSQNTIETEINSATDNPLVFPNGDIVSGGNFHGQPLAIAMDLAAIALAEFASISERRTFLLLGGHDGLPTLLMTETGINSGFMIPQYTAAALVSENKVLCHPASVDSIPTSLGQEDHQSMGSISALKLLQIFKNVETVLAIELFTAAQALDFRKPLNPGQGVERAHQYVRSLVPHRAVDHYFEKDLSHCCQILRDQEFLSSVEETSGELN
jgi:histidine ammonia-lyase